ncbi:MAG TPA: HAMP domain-containing sensor histidine kinase [Cyclobacteriaceae bacterium]|nr:HAMP domain-containing sensor histidine kinase [Cyclobacteriaceae bacterium]
MKRLNAIPIALMTSSIVLLLLLQVLWLVNSYDDAYTDLRRRTSDLFRGTIVEMRDSIFLRNFQTISVDSVHRRSEAIFFSFDLDTVKGNKKQSRAEILYKGPVPDSLPRMRSNITAFDDGKKVVVRFTPDSLSTDTIAHHFQTALAMAGIDLPFAIKTNRQKMEIIPDDIIKGNHTQIRKRIERPTPPEITAASGSIATEWVRFSPEFGYASVLSNVKPYLFWQISPQILFSFALTLITSAAFWLMYRSMRSQQRLMQMKNDFISNITHELKTPVTTVSVALEALRNFKGLENPQTTKEYLDIAQGELNRLTILTDKVLKTAVLDNPEVNIENEQVDLNKTVDQILHSMKLIFEKQKAHVSFEKQGDSFTIRGGSVHITNVIYNLLDNALKYSGSEPQISIRLEESANQVILKVADKGIGIPPEYRKKIFEKFFRVPTGDVHNIKGYGLGLSYVESVVRSHRGLIEVVSRPGEGSVFTISLPKGL